MRIALLLVVCALALPGQVFGSDGFDESPVVGGLGEKTSLWGAQVVVTPALDAPVLQPVVQGPSVVEIPVVEGAAEDVVPVGFSANMSAAKKCPPKLTVTPYGWLWGSMKYDSQRTNPGVFTTYVLSPEVQGEDAMYIDARRSRFGLNIGGPDIPMFGGMQSGGKVEIDFIGEFLDNNQSRARLRHVYWEAKNDKHRMLIGQTWDLMSPLLPRTLNFSVGWAGGNIGFRRAQFLYERKGRFDCGPAWSLAGSLNEDISPDFPTATDVVRETANYPLIEGRAGLTLNPDAGAMATTIGVSGHCGETGFDFNGTGPAPLNLPPQDDARYDTWSYNFDLKMPVTERLSFQAEFFQGENMSPFLGGIGQGVCQCNRQTIGTIGGWADMQYQWNDWFATTVGAGVDDPENSDFYVGRSYNRFIFVNAIVTLSEHLSTGIEVTDWRTNYQDTRPTPLSPTTAGESVTTEWMVKYVF